MVADDGHSNYAQAFITHNLPTCNLSETEFASTVASFVPQAFFPLLPGENDKINEFSPNVVAISVEHFELGLRLPLWTEVRQVLRYFGFVLAQISPNSIAMLVAFACYLREEKIEFSLPVFRKLFSLRCKGGIAVFSGQTPFKTWGSVDQTSDWVRRFLFVTGNFDNIPLAPIQEGEVTYYPPALGGHEAKLYHYLSTEGMDVVYCRRNVDLLQHISLGEGK